MKRLFVDRSHIQRLDRVRQIFHQPVKDAGPVVAPDRPWEEERLHIWSAPIWCADRQRWRMWYIGGEDLLPLYAESMDGLHWEKPVLDRVDWNGSRENNIVNLGFEAQDAKERRLVLLRDDRDPLPARRYKALTRVSGRLVGLASPDGLDWASLPGAAVPSNDEYRLGYDSIRQQFLATVKGSPVPEFGRAVSLSVSDDFVHWSPNELIFWGDQVDQELGRQRIAQAMNDPDRRSPQVNDPALSHTDIYNMPVFSYADLYLGLPVVFNHSGLYWYRHPDDDPPKLRSNQDGILQPSLVSSQNLVDWERGDRAPFIPLSPLSDPANYDHGAIHACAPVIAGDELWFYYTGTRFTHLKRSLIEEAGLRTSPDEPMGAIFRARLRLDGFASLTAGSDPGVVLTRPVEVEGPHLYVNADASRGEIRVELRDAASGRVIPGYGMGDMMGDPWLYSDDGQSRRLRFGTGARFEDDMRTDDSLSIRENGTAIPVRWKAAPDVRALLGRRIRICFRLRDADLFAFEFGA